MKQLLISICIAVTTLSLTACNRDTTSPTAPKTKQADSISPAPVRPGDSTTPAVPGPGAQPPMPDVNKKQ
jgi:hypothetical protein